MFGATSAQAVSERGRDGATGLCGVPAPCWKDLRASKRDGNVFFPREPDAGVVPYGIKPVAIAVFCPSDPCSRPGSRKRAGEYAKLNPVTHSPWLTHDGECEWSPKRCSLASPGSS